MVLQDHCSTHAHTHLYTILVLLYACETNNPNKTPEKKASDFFGPHFPAAAQKRRHLIAGRHGLALLGHGQRGAGAEPAEGGARSKWCGVFVGLAFLVFFFFSLTTGVFYMFYQGFIICFGIAAVSAVEM